MTADTVEALAREIGAATSVVTLTGAGVSTASGVPSFRGEDGIWAQFDQRDFHYQRFQTDPAGFWADRVELREVLVGDGEIVPNAAHEALVELEQAGHLDAVITQNVDGLHDAAGSETVIQLHGTNQTVKCMRCGARKPSAPVVKQVRDEGGVPHCWDCSGVLKPAVVLFGEPLPDELMQEAQRLAEQSEVFLAVGSSLQVQPAASLPGRAQQSGATLAVVNLESTPVSEQADYDIRRDVTEVLPAIVEQVD